MTAATPDSATVIGPVLLSTGLSRAAGGPFFSVSGLARALAETGDCLPSVVGSYFDDAWSEDEHQWSGIALTASRGRGLRSAFTLARDAGAAVTRARAAGRHVVLHVSGLWDAASLAAALVTRSGRVPYVISPRGMLEPWALGQKRARKRLALLLWQHSLLANADLLHATSDLECQSIRAAGLRNPVCVIPNGIEPAAAPAARPPGGPLRCVFLSRIHPKKGLPLLLEAWSRVRPAGWTLDIAGHVQDHEHEQELRRLIAARRLDGVTIVGERSGPEKWAFLGAADLFVLPSYSENFGIVVAEAMAAGLPVITTTGTPWRVLTDEAMGWRVVPTVDALAAALHEAVSEPAERRADRGRRARSYALARFGWPEIGRRMAACYRWLVGRGPATPDIEFASP